MRYYTAYNMTRIILCLGLLFLGNQGLAQQKLQSWEETLERKEAVVPVYYFQIPGYISQENGKFSGLEYDMLMGFQKFVEDYYRVNLQYKFIEKQAFSEVYKQAKEAKEGAFFISSFSITDQRKKEVSFSPSYMPDISVMVSSMNLPILKDTAAFIEKFGHVQGVVVPKTTLDEMVKSVKQRFLPDLQIIEQKNFVKVWEYLMSHDNVFTFMQLDSYFSRIKSGDYLHRQNIFKSYGQGRAIVLAKGSDWQKPLEAFFDQEPTQAFTEKVIRKYFGQDAQELIIKVGDSRSEFDQSEIEILTRERDLNLKQVMAKDEALVRRNWMIALGGLSIVLLIGMAFVIQGRYKFQKKTQRILMEKNNEIITQNEELIQQSEEISSQRDALESQHKLLVQKDQMIGKSLNTAQFIQKAIMPSRNTLAQYFKDYFLLYRPRDVVSGDFYWVHTYKENMYIVVGDCTGHGVPGAFISLIAIMLLQEIIVTQKINGPGDILNTLHESLKKTLCQDQNQDNNGLDLVVCRLKNQKNKTSLVYASAKRPLYIYGKETSTMKKIKGTRKSIGGLQNESISFESKQIDLHPGDMMYLFTDGLADQNNVKRKKFGEPQLLQTLEEVSTLGTDKQLQKLEALLDSHMVQTEQRDDITGIGLRI